MHRRLGGSTGAALLVALVLHLTSTVHAADVTSQVAPFRLEGTMLASCFTTAVISALGDLDVPPTEAELNVAISVLVSALSNIVVDVKGDGNLSIQRHGKNGAVHHLEWGASLTQAAMVLTAIDTNTEATACARVTGTSVSRVGESFTALATAGAFVQVGADISSSAGGLATAQNLAIVDAKNITEARTLIAFTTESFVSAESNTAITLLADILTRAASFNNFAPGVELDGVQVTAAIQAAAQAVVKALASTSVQNVIKGHYKAMAGQASQTDILKVTEAASEVSVKTVSEVSVTVNTSVNVSVNGQGK